jgi:hypothetical protein
MNVFTYIKSKYEHRRRRREAIKMLMKSGAIRSADRLVRYQMTSREFGKLMRSEEA